MTDEEKLEDIKMWHEGDVDLHQFQIDWLIGQAERVHELTEKIKTMKEVGVANYYAYQERLYDIDDLTEQNKRCHEALEFYADESNHVHRVDDESMVDIDGGHRANQVLRGDDYWREEL